eukprot:SAG31_NODE_19953_length_587_cov_1.747951_1_plen_185_part_01
MGGGVLNAIEFVCGSPVAVIGFPISALAAGVVCELVGRNEEGKTLSQEAVFAVLSLLVTLADEEADLHMSNSITHRAVLRAGTMAISDTNKRVMLEFDGLVGVLVNALLIGSPRRATDGADAVQEAAVELILTLSLFTPWAKLLRAETSGVVKGLHAVLADESATESAVRSAQQALFELEGRAAN